MTDEQISGVFAQAGDFIRRELHCGSYTLYAYAIDGLVSSADAAESIFRPIGTNLAGESMEELYRKALHGTVYNTVAGPCKDLNVSRCRGSCL